MRYVRAVINFLAATVIVFVTLYFVTSLCILVFKVTGLLVDGPMYFEMRTPTYEALFIFQCICIAIILACLSVRIILGRKNDFLLFSKRYLTRNLK